MQNILDILQIKLYIDCREDEGKAIYPRTAKPLKEASERCETDEKSEDESGESCQRHVAK